jgi:hypothetical protein
LTDPLVRRVHIWNGSKPGQGAQDPLEHYLTENLPFQGGYRDFTPHLYGGLNPNVATPGPPRVSLRGDLNYYLQHHARDFGTLADDPKIISKIVQKIVASHMQHVLTYTAGLLMSFEWPLLRKDDLSNINMTRTEGMWSAIQTNSRRCADIVHNLEENMLALGIAPEKSKERPTLSWINSDEDFRHLLQRAKDLKEHADSLNDALTGLMGIVGNAQAGRETKTVKILTLIALVFIPLSFTSGLFSMGDEYLPGERRFWTFFAVSIPLILIIFAIAGLVDIGYGRDSVWSPQNYVQVFQELHMGLSG